MQSPLQILFIDDHIGLLEGISSILKTKDSSLQFFLASNTESAQRIFKAKGSISLIVADLNIDGEDGIKAISILRKIREVPCIIYSMYSDLFHVKAALAANVQGYVSKKSSTEELLRTIHTVAEGRSFYCTETMKTITKLLYDKSPAEPSETQMLFLNYKSLSRSEKELFELLAEKKSIAEIASALGKSEKTILNKRTIICQKLLLHDRLDIVDAAKTLGGVIG